MEPDFPWPRPLHHRPGAPDRLEGIDVFYDFKWSDYFPDGRAQFRNGKCLAQQVLGECPQGRKPALLLTCLDEEEERSIRSASLFILVINFPRYLKLADANAAVSYLARNFGPGITNISQFNELAGQTPEQIRAFFEQQLTAKRIAEWAAGNAKRMTALRKMVGTEKADEENPVPVADVITAFRGLDDLDAEEAEQFKALLSDPDKRRLVDFINENDLLSADLIRSVDYHRRCTAVGELEEMLSKDLTEAPWQHWFEENDWVLGTEFVQLLEERSIDVEHIADYLMEAYDGFVDLVEIKRPEGKLKFWADAKDHGNYIPHTELIKAITQASRYILEVEREANSVKFLERIGGVKAIKPRCVVIYGRSAGWTAKQRESYRVLNASYYNLTIMTFDHVLARAKRILDLEEDP